MIGHRCDLIDEMIRQRTRAGVMAASEVTSDMPEYRDIYTQFPGTDWDTRARGLGATATDRWANTYAATNSDEYFAELVQSYFDTNIAGPIGGDGIHNDIDTRVGLATYDPAGHAVVDALFGDASSLDLCNG